MKPSLILAPVLALLLAACPEPAVDPGEDPAVPPDADAVEVLLATSGRLVEVTSGALALSFTAARQDRDDEVGMEVEGPFMVLPGETPVASFTTTRIIGEERLSATMYLSGHEIFVERDGDLDPVAADRVPPVDHVPGVEVLALERWIQEPRLEEGPEADGVATERITGDLRADVALADIMALTGRFGEAGIELGEVEAQHLDRVMRESEVEILTGTEDRFLRHLELRLLLGLDEAVDQAPEPVELRFELSLERVNERIDPPLPDEATP